MPQIPVDQVVLILAAIVAPVFTAGAAWMAVKGSVNGMRRDVAETRVHVEKLVESDARQNERLGVIETKIEAYSGWIRRVEDTANLASERRKEPRE